MGFKRKFKLRRTPSVVFALLGCALLPSGCLEQLKKAEGIECDSEEYKEFANQKYLEQVWGGPPPTKELSGAVQNRTDFVAVDVKDLDKLSDAKEYEITLTGQDAGKNIRWTSGTIGCFTTPGCVKSDGSLRKEGMVCADSAAKPFELYLRSAENYTCEGFTLATTNADWKSKRSDACAGIPSNQSAQGVFRFRIVGSLYQDFAGSARLWFTDDDGRAFQSDLGLAP